VPALTTTARIESWPIAGSFVIARGAKTEARVVIVEISAGQAVGRGECVPYPRYGQTPEATLAEIRAWQPCDRQTLQRRMPPGAARNAIDCALWDLEAKQAGMTVAALAGLPAPVAMPTCFTLSLDTPERMATAARAARAMPVLKLKLGGGSIDAERMRRVRAARPDVTLLADANESWCPEDLDALLAVAAETGMTLIEQPLPAHADGALAGTSRLVPICADESAHARDGLEALADRYDAVNIKLDKTGGLTEALAMAEAAHAAGLDIMVGCMVATSLSMAPALLLAGRARWVDLDGAALLARDRRDGLVYRDGVVHPPSPALWG
jgi:L-alanine-DL-glutamate epimerase-like enolase superfamily enzyme